MSVAIFFSDRTMTPSLLLAVPRVKWYHTMARGLPASILIIFFVCVIQSTTFWQVFHQRPIPSSRTATDQRNQPPQRPNTSVSTSSTTISQPPVQVYILMGQSNMLGFGLVRGRKSGSLEYAVHEHGLFPYLIDKRGQWAQRRNVRYVRVVEGLQQSNARIVSVANVTENKWLRVSATGRIGPEFGIGHTLADSAPKDSRIMLIKSCAGNRALGWDLLPPGSKRFQVTDRSNNVTWVYAGYKDAPHRWELGTEPKQVQPGDWYAGKQYDGDIARAQHILNNIGEYYPGATEYQVAGFFWWQGNKDSQSTVYSKRYRLNLARLIKELRRDFQAPHAKFVCASLGEAKKGSVNNAGRILKAMQKVDGRSGQYPKFAGNVGYVYTHPLIRGNGYSGNHYNLHAETFMNVGEAMGKDMVRLQRLKSHES